MKRSLLGFAKGQPTDEERAALARQAEEADARRADRQSREPDVPLFSEAVHDGTCPHCSGHQFRRARVQPGKAALGTGRFSGSGLTRVGGVVGMVRDVRQSAGFVECVTCGKLFRQG